MNEPDRKKFLATVEFLQIFLGECSQGRLPTREDLEEMHQKLDLVEYLITPRQALGEDPICLGAGELPVCSFETCLAKATSLWNIASSRPQAEPVWRCRDHIPPELTFPIGLWGEDWLATGRAKPKGRDER